MSKDKTNKDNKKFWERVAKLYTKIQEKGNKDIYGPALDFCGKYIKEGDNVLEIACGTGQFTFALCKNCGSYQATDFSQKMVDECKKQMSENKVKNMENVKFSVADCTNLNFEDNSFDVVVIANALHVMPNPIKAISEIKRVLKKDGVLIAPNFTYDGKINKFRLFFVELAGFKTFNKWKKSEFENFVCENGFSMLESTLINGKMLPETIVIGKNIK